MQIESPDPTAASSVNTQVRQHAFHSHVSHTVWDGRTALEGCQPALVVILPGSDVTKAATKRCASQQGFDHSDIYLTQGYLILANSVPLNGNTFWNKPAIM